VRLALPKQVRVATLRLVSQIASRGCEVGSADRRQADRSHGSLYRLIRRPALAEIVGDGRPYTVLMISLLSMPWR
jgi:hypothetical protein